MPIEPRPDDRAERMVADPGQYFVGARQRAEATVTQPASGRSRRKFHPRPTPGVVRLSVRACSQGDLDWLIGQIRARGFTVWVDNGGKAIKHDDHMLGLYFSVEVPEDEA